MIVLAIRHGVTSWNAQQRWQGATDIPLAVEGRVQAGAAARRLRAEQWSGSSVFCSSLSRSRVTAETICTELGIDEPQIIPQLGERELGKWEGLSVDEVEAGYPGSIAMWTAGRLEGPPDGETDAEVAARFREACERIRVATSESAQPVLVVTHAGVLHAVDKVNGSGFSKYGPLCGRWFDLATEELLIDGHVDLLSEEVGFTQPALTP